MMAQALTFGLDLAAGGRDFSAAVVVERVEVETDAVESSLDGCEHWVSTEAHHLVRHLVRWPVGTDPLDVVRDVVELCDRPALDGAMVVYDKTGLGQGVSGFLREQAREGRLQRYPRGVTIHGGDESRRAGSVSKIDLVSQTARMLHQGRLKIARGLEHGEQLRRELLAFQVKVLPSGRERFEADRESTHDDLLTALMLAVWRPNRVAGARHLSVAPEV